MSTVRAQMCYCIRVFSTKENEENTHKESHYDHVEGEVSKGPTLSSTPKAQHQGLEIAAIYP